MCEYQKNFTKRNVEYIEYNVWFFFHLLSFRFFLFLFVFLFFFCLVSKQFDINIQKETYLVGRWENIKLGLLHTHTRTEKTNTGEDNTYKIV